jgi:predicted Zn-dependent peptidase
MSKAVVTERTLSNGLKIICESSPRAQSVGVGFFVQTGSRDETVKESGVSHFLEHMLFKGTPKRSALELTFDMGNIGAQANAFTSEENTVYYATVLPEYLPQMQDILSDMMRPSLDPQEFSTEKNVILEEIALYDDRPQFYLFDNATTHFFGEHPAGNSVLGSTDSIKALTRDEMKNYFDRRYAPNNMVFVCAGNINAEEVIARAEKMCGDWKNFETPRAKPEFKCTKKGKIFKKPNVQQSHLLLLAEGPSAQDPDRYALSLFSMILGDSTGSRLYYDLVQPGIAESASADTDERDSVGGFYGYAVTEPDKLDEVSRIMHKAIQDARHFSDADLARAKTKSISRIVASGELPMGRLMALGNEWLYRREIQNLQELMADIKAVTTQDIHRALGRFPFLELSEYRLIPE